MITGFVVLAIAGLFSGMYITAATAVWVTLTIVVIVILCIGVTFVPSGQSDGPGILILFAIGTVCFVVPMWIGIIMKILMHT